MNKTLTIYSKLIKYLRVPKFLFLVIIIYFIYIKPLNAELNLDCGINKFQNDPPLTERILGGNSSHEGEWPWQVSLRLKHPLLESVNHWCGATLISDQWIVTASHCIISPVFSLPQPGFWIATLGLHSQNMINESHVQISKVQKVIYHPWYKGFENDIALMKLDQPVVFNDHVQPVCLPSSDLVYNVQDLNCVTTGWGRTDQSKKNPEILQKIHTRIYDNSVCQKVYYSRFRIFIKESHLCAGSSEGGRGTCHGDSGGPLQCKIDGNRWYLYGITSFGSNCAKPGFPDIYSKVQYYLDWIKQVQENYD